MGEDRARVGGYWADGHASTGPAPVEESVHPTLKRLALTVGLPRGVKATGTHPFNRVSHVFSDPRFIGYFDRGRAALSVSQ